MTLSLYRSRWQVYHGDYAAVDAYEWSFAPIEPTRSVGRITGCLMSREPDGEVLVVTPPFAQLVDVGERRSPRLTFHGEDGIDAESVASLAAKGERGFKVSEDDAMAKKSVEQPSLFGDPEPPGPTGAHGRRPPREDRVTPVVEALKEHAEAGREGRPSVLAVTDEGELAARMTGKATSPKKVADHPWLKAKLYDVCQICLGTQTVPPETRICVDPPDAIAKAEHRADGSIVCPFCDRGFAETGLTVGQVERWRKVIDEAEALARERGIDPMKAAKPTSPKQAAIDGAGVDLVADVDAAIKQIRDGSGITAIRILERVRNVLAKGRATV